MHNTLALFITFLLGFFIIIGVIIALFLKKQKKVLDFIFAFALSILTMLILVDLLGHTIEHLGIKHIYLFILFTCLGLLIFKIIDDFVPEHEDAKMTKKEEKKNIVHIGVLATIALIIHNFVEGMAIYLTATNDINGQININYIGSKDNHGVIGMYTDTNSTIINDGIIMGQDHSAEPSAGTITGMRGQIINQELAPFSKSC